MFSATIYSMKVIQQNPHIIDSLSCILNLLSVIDLSVISFNTFRGLHSVPKEFKYRINFLTINNEA